MEISRYKKFRWIVVFLLCSYSSLVKAQEETKWFNNIDIGIEHSFFINVDIYSIVALDSDTWKEPNVKSSHATSTEKLMIVSGGAEFLSSDKEIIAAPKISATYFYSNSHFLYETPLFFRLDASLYTNFNKVQSVLTPKIGLGFTEIHVFYGRNIALNHQSFEG